MARFGIPSEHAFGIGMDPLRRAGKRLGRDHDLALALWETGWYEARAVATFVDDPARVTPAQMDRWCRDFDDWATCDTACFCLFDKTPHAFGRVAAWARRKPEFERRAAFALLASLALHDEASPDERFLRCLPLAERAASDERNFVKKGVSWALRGVGTRSRALHAACTATARRLAAAESPAARWVGHDVLRDLSRPMVARRVARREAARA
jgi:3-methyladenine DNA glycosylase AlkD